MKSSSWDAAVTMAGRALQAATRKLGATPSTLAKEIDELGTRGVLTGSMVEWAHEIRLLRNISAHPDLVELSVEEGDAKDVMEFLDYLLIYAFDLPHQITEYKARRSQKKAP